MPGEEVMIELRWAVLPHTTTQPPRLQYRLSVAVDASGAFCPGTYGEWKDIPHVVLPNPPRETDEERDARMRDAGFVKRAT